MSNLDDIFGPFPGRPSHPDMQALSEIVVALDSMADNAETFDLVAEINERVDFESLMHLAFQRLLRVGAATILTSPDLAQVATSLYCDAFMVGVEFGRRRAAEAADAATIAEVFGDEPTD